MERVRKRQGLGWPLLAGENFLRRKLSAKGAQGVVEQGEHQDLNAQTRVWECVWEGVVGQLCTPPILHSICICYNYIGGGARAQPVGCGQLHMTSFILLHQTNTLWVDEVGLEVFHQPSIFLLHE